jgi:uncharacterized membrane protein YedE/YeeE
MSALSILTQYWPNLAGGVLIGLACAAYLLFDGRIAGISGILGRVLAGRPFLPGAALLAGLVAGPGLWRLITGAWPAVHVQASWPVLVVAGLLVGFGTRMGSGCTSGHGVMGLARLSPRSMVAVCCFLGTGVLCATVFHLAGWR